MALALPLALALALAPRDTDRDGIPDRVEDANQNGRVDPGETDPQRLDSDRDGVPDGVEDADRDGRVDPGESNPRVPGLFPGSGPHIPEPMLFDMVRGLGARAGEVEVNTLVTVPWGGRRRDLELDWAPEIEWAPIHGLALELELPMQNGHLHALKAAAQRTFQRPRARPAFIDGVQALVEARPGVVDTTALYLLGYRLDRRWSALGMAGARLEWIRGGAPGVAVLANPSVFVDLRERVTLGVEHNLALPFHDPHERRVRPYAAVIPQLHIQVARQWRLQLGGGLRLDHGRLRGLGGLRLIFEL